MFVAKRLFVAALRLKERKLKFHVLSPLYAAVTKIGKVYLCDYKMKQITVQFFLAHSNRDPILTQRKAN